MAMDSDPTAPSSPGAASESDASSGSTISPNNGTVTLGTSAGTVEGLLLGARAINEIADLIGCEIEKSLESKSNPTPTIIVGIESDRADIHAYMLFETWCESVSSNFDALSGTHLRPESSRSESVGLAAVALETITSATGVATAIDGLLGFFRSSYQIDSLTIETDELMLMTALASVFRRKDWKVLLPSQFPGKSSLGVQNIQGKLKILYEYQMEINKRVRALTRSLEAPERADAVPTNGLSNSDKDARTKEIDTELDQWQSLFARIETGLGDLGKSDESGIKPLVRIMRIALMYDDLSQHSIMIIPHLHRAAGSIQTTTNLWSAFGMGPPIMITGGALASYLAFDCGTGELISAALVPRHGGQIPISAVKSQVNLDCKPPPKRV